MATNLPELRPVERLSKRVIRILGGNPGKFTLQGTNTYLVGVGPSRILIDTGAGETSWICNLVSTLSSEHATLSAVLITHWHPDHTGGIRDVMQQVAPRPIIFKHSPLPERQQAIDDGQRFELDGGETILQALHCPGHTRDHMAFVLQQEGALFTGDNVLGHGTAVFEDLATYLASLVTMRAAVQEGRRGYPGHGAVLEDCAAKIAEYVRHREMREMQVVEVLGRGMETAQVGEGMGSMDLVKVIYKDTPENLHFAAARGVVQILEKLVGEGRVVYHEKANTWSLSRRATL